MNMTVTTQVHFQRGRRTRKTLEPGPEPVKPLGRLPRVTKIMALAIRFEGLIRDGVVASPAELARLGQVTRARMSQIMLLLNLAPEIQEAVLHLPRVAFGSDPLFERDPRRIAVEPDWGEQRRLWAKLVATAGASS